MLQKNGTGEYHPQKITCGIISYLTNFMIREHLAIESEQYIYPALP
uniref:Uncharacterized protein n=1 Tax=Arundo donax TaxID=35708 RepID=A0A0A9B626_ARUDO